MRCRCLVKMVTRLQRDYLSQPTLSGDGTGLGDSAAEALEFGVADWARPWGPSCLLQLQADMNVLRPQAEELAAMAFQVEPERCGGEGRGAFRRDHGPHGGRPQAGPVHAARMGLERPGGRPNDRLRGPPNPCAGSRSRPPRPVASRRVEPRPAAPRRFEPRPAAPRRDGPAPAAVADRRLDLNQVSFEQLRSLDLSTTQCHRVLAYRKRLRGFDSIDQLDEVPGFPKGMREALRHRLTV